MNSDMTKNQTDRVIDSDSDDFDSVSGVAYEQRDGEHLIQLHLEDSDTTHEIVIERDSVAVGFRDLGQKMLEEMESDWADIDTTGPP